MYFRQTSFNMLSPVVRERAMRQPLIVAAHRNYVRSRAPVIDNRQYWETIVEKFEADKLEDHTLDPHINSFLDKLVNPSKPIIEFGCGIGRTASVLLSRGYTNYLGIDIAARAVKLASERLPGAKFSTGDIIDFNPTEKFNAAIATDALLYLSPVDQIQALLNIRNIVEPLSPILFRWAPGEDEIVVKSKTVGEQKIEGWVFLATERYIRSIINIARLDPDCSFLRETVVINPGTPYEKPQDYLVISARTPQQ